MKKSACADGPHVSMRKMFLIMRLSLIFLLLALQVSAINYGQKLNLNEKNISITDMFKKIEKQSSYRFYYSNDVIPTDKFVSVNVINASLKEVLKEVFDGSGLIWSVLNNNRIVVSTKNSSNLLEAGVLVRKITGRVTNEAGEPLESASIVVKGTNVGVLTNAEGYFSIDVPDGTVTIQVTDVGYDMQELTLSPADANVNIVMKVASSSNLSEVVVTALGIKRQERSLPYATQQISGKDLNQVPSSNLLSNLAGKTAGMTVSNSGAGVGSSVKVLLRGNRSIFGNNQPLYIVDGTPINSKSFTDGANADGGYGGAIDAGDGMAGINPEDIESINVLKGASAAALYGSKAANGVVVITTKRGSGERIDVNVNSSYQADMPYMTYKFQDGYAMGSEGVSQSSNMQWGAKNAGKDLSNTFINDFFRTGNLWMNSVSLSGGSKSIKNYFSYQNTNGKGIMPNNNYNKHNVALRSTTSLFDNFLEVDGSLALMRQDIKNAPSAPGRYFNPIVGLYLYPEGTTEFNKYKNQFEIFAPEKNIMKQNWAHEEDVNKNPYWLTNRYSYNYFVNKAIAKANLTFNFTKYLNLKLRGSYDYTKMDYERRVNWGVSVITGGQGGRYEVFNDAVTDSYGDALLNFNKTYNELSVMATLGTSVSDYKIKRTANRISLKIPNFFHLNNVEGRPINYESAEHRQLQSVFGTVSLGYQNMLYLDITGRNDWASTLPAANNSYFYPSVGAAFVFTELMNKAGSKPDWLSFGKFRISATQVGNDMPWGKTIVYDALNEAGDVEKNTVAPFKDLKPEKSTSFETGLNLRMFDNRVNLDVAFYKTKTANQYFLVDAPAGTGYSQYFINAGEIGNTGFEATLGFEPVRTDNLRWSSIFNFTTNKNKILSLPEQYAKDGLKLTSGGFTYLLKQGEEWGEMYMKRAKRDDQGRVIVTEKDGKQQLQDADTETRIGNVNSKFMLGWSNQVTYKNFSVNFQFDGRFGGKVVSSTQAILNKYGRSQETAEARNAGGIKVPAVDAAGNAYTKPIDAQVWYTSLEGGLAMYNATNMRLRELSVGYSLPKRIFEGTKYIKDVRLSLIGRNLLYVYRDAPFDPEMVLSTTTNSTSNVDNFSIPMSRSIGFSININL